MASYQIKVKLYEEQRAVLQFVVLENIRIGLEFRYSNLDEEWFMWLRESNGTYIAGPIKLVAGDSDLLRQYHYNTSVPPGRLYCSETPTFDTIDLTAILTYEDS